MMSCRSAGNCTVAGTYTDAAVRTQAFSATERNGTWGAATPIPGLSAVNVFGATVTALSCGDVGRCAAGGAYVDAAGASQPWVADSTGGTFGAAHRLITLGAVVQRISTVTSISCALPGNCTAGLSLAVIPPGQSPESAAFVASEVNGTWSAVQALPSPVRAGGPPPPDAINSLSCWSPGNCLAGGYYNSNGVLHTLVALQSGGAWVNLQFTEIPGITNLLRYNAAASNMIRSVSCVASGDCSLVGSYTDTSLHTQVFDAAKTAGGSWFAQTLPGSAELNIGGNAQLASVSCAAAGDCATSGFSLPGPGIAQSLVDVEQGGSWVSAQEILGIANLPSALGGPVSCGGVGSCSAVGWYTDTAGHRQAYVVNETSHAWGGAIGVAGNLNTGGVAESTAVSCASAGICAAGGTYADAAGNIQGFVVDES
jgi:hypothetical protein